MKKQLVIAATLLAAIGGFASAAIGSKDATATTPPTESSCLQPCHEVPYQPRSTNTTPVTIVTGKPSNRSTSTTAKASTTTTSEVPARLTKEQEAIIGSAPEAPCRDERAIRDGSHQCVIPEQRETMEDPTTTSTSEVVRAGDMDGTDY